MLNAVEILNLSRDGFSRAQLRPFARFLREALATDNIPLHFDIVLPGPNIDVNGRNLRFKIGIFGDVRLLVLRFYGVIGFAAIDKMTINTNTHSRNSMRFLKF